MGPFQPGGQAPVGPLRQREHLLLAALDLAERAHRCLSARLDRAHDDVAHTRGRLLALSPAATLRRGYAIIQRADGTVVRTATQVAQGEKLTVRFAEDQMAVVTERTDRPETAQITPPST